MERKLMDRMEKNNPDMEKKLSLLKDDFKRDPQKTAAGRAEFLLSAKQLHKNLREQPEKPSGRNQDHNRGYRARNPVFSMLLTIFLAVALVMGTGVATVAASKNSQPDGMLYSVKLASEDIALELANDPAKQFDLALEFEQYRSEEIILLIENGKIPSDEIFNRYQSQIQRAIRKAITLPDDSAIRTLSFLQTELESQKDTLLESFFIQPDGMHTATQKLLVMVNGYVNLCKAGQENLAWLREQFQSRDSSGDVSDTLQPYSTPEPSAGTASSGNNGNPQATHTRTPGSGNSQGGGIGNTKTHTPPAWGAGGKDTRTPTETPEGYDPTDEKVPPGQGKKDN